MVHRREVRAERHVVEVRVGLGRAERRIDQFLVVAGQRNVPRGELLLQRAELAARQVVAEAARAAVRQERDAAVAAGRRLPRRGGRGRCRSTCDDFAFAEMVAAAVGAELA